MNAADLPASLAAAWVALLHAPPSGITQTLGPYVLACRRHRSAGQNALLMPVPVAAFFGLTGIGYEMYMADGEYLAFLPGPATVARSIPLDRAGWEESSRTMVVTGSAFSALR